MRTVVGISNRELKDQPSVWLRILMAELSISDRELKVILSLCLRAAICCLAASQIEN